MNKDSIKKFKLIVGLGNPGDKYQGTRHNVGFMFIDYVLEQKFSEGVQGKKLKNSLVYTSDDVVYAKPQLYMNKSGSVVKELVKWFEIDIESELLVVHDDLDIQLGTYKLQYAKSPKLHNGIISVEQHLGTNKFWRLRIGIDNRKGKRIDGEKYVLQKFTQDEYEQLQTTFQEIDFQ